MTKIGCNKRANGFLDFGSNIDLYSFENGTQIVTQIIAKINLKNFQTVKILDYR